MTWSSDTSPAGTDERSARTPGLPPLGADGPRRDPRPTPERSAPSRQRRRLDHPPRVPRKRPRREGEAQEAVRRRRVEMQPERRQHGADEAVEWAGDRVESRARPYAPRVECARGHLHALAALDVRLDLPERAVGQPEREAVAHAALEVEPAQRDRAAEQRREAARVGPSFGAPLQHAHVAEPALLDGDGTIPVADVQAIVLGDDRAVDAGEAHLELAADRLADRAGDPLHVGAAGGLAHHPPFARRVAADQAAIGGGLPVRDARVAEGLVHTRILTRSRPWPP